MPTIQPPFSTVIQTVRPPALFDRLGAIREPIQVSVR
jgi:hypothetical protein